jgi:multicomponent Na+:H+ antiporter subunit C
MAGNFFANYYEIIALVLFGTGFTILLVNQNLVKKVLGLNIVDAAVYLFLAAKGYVAGRAAPIIADGIQDAAVYVNPVPTGLILTGIVISVSVTAFSVSLIVTLYKRYESLDLDEITRIVSGEEEE